ncbi:MAG TPA: carboxymuconolactone decarboxylase family protein [Terriglobales bacterium]|nr:carboxymuconolactone decarboxylase family protein [Terriglobales bacterium]
MARVSLIEPASARPEVQQIYEHRLRGKPAAIHKAMAHNHHALLPFLSFNVAAGMSLDRSLWEKVYLRVSFLNGCNYCAQHHMKSSTTVGLDVDGWRALKAGDLTRFPETEQVALQYAEKLTRDPGGIADDDVAKLKEHFSDQQIVDLHLLCGLANLTNRFTGPLGLELEFEPVSL